MSNLELIEIFKKENYSDILHEISFLNTVKCSPGWYKSKPNDLMRANCIEKFLLSEIKVLNPQKIIIFDRTSYNLLKSKAKIISDEVKQKRTSYVKIMLDNNIIELFYIIHPQAFGGNAINIAKELSDLKNKIY